MKNEIKIQKLENGTWNVIIGDKYSEKLGYDECIGLVTTLIVNNSTKNCLSWLKTKEQHEIYYKRLHNTDKPKLLVQNIEIK